MHSSKKSEGKWSVHNISKKQNKVDDLVGELLIINGDNSDKINTCKSRLNEDIKEELPGTGDIGDGIIDIIVQFDDYVREHFKNGANGMDQEKLEAIEEYSENMRDFINKFTNEFTALKSAEWCIVVLAETIALYFMILKAEKDDLNIKLAKTFKSAFGITNIPLKYTTDEEFMEWVESLANYSISVATKKRIENEIPLDARKQKEEKEENYSMPQPISPQNLNQTVLAIDPYSQSEQLILPSSSKSSNLPVNQNVVAKVEALEEKIGKNKAQSETYGDEYGYENRRLYKYKKGDQLRNDFVHVHKDAETAAKDHPGNVDPAKEAHAFGKELFAAAKSLMTKNRLVDDVIKLGKRVDAYHDAIKAHLPTPIIGYVADQTRSNKPFNRKLKVIKKLNTKLVKDICVLAKCSSKQLEKEGYRLRGEKRPDVYYTWKIHNKPEKFFILYEPVGRYTQAQWEKQRTNGKVAVNSSDEKDEKTIPVKRTHATTSHQKTDWNGTANFVRYTAGVIGNGKVKVLHQSFGRGALPPNEDYEKAKKDPVLRWEILATAMRNEKEILTEYAVTKISNLTDDEIRMLLKNREIALADEIDAAPSHILRALLKDNLSKIYDKDHPLIIREFYTQVVSPGQTIAHEFQESQFKDTRRALELCNSGVFYTHIQVTDMQEAQIYVKPKSSMVCFGVNRSRWWTTEEQDHQNERGMNFLFDAFFKNFHMVATQCEKIKTEYLEINSTLFALREHLIRIKGINNDDITNLEFKIGELEVEIINNHQRLAANLTKLSELNSQINDQSDATDPDYHRKWIEACDANQQTIQEKEKNLFDLHHQLNELRKKQWQDNHHDINVVLKTLRVQVVKFPKGNDDDKKKLKYLHNICRIQNTILNLYYNNKWKNAQYNFLLQSLCDQQSALLNMFSNTGCKSCNDRGIAEKMTALTNVFVQELSGHGLNPGQDAFYGDLWRQVGLDVFPVLSELNHTFNTGNTGGKCELPNAGPHNVSVASQIATWSKLAVNKGISEKNDQKIALRERARNNLNISTDCIIPVALSAEFMVAQKAMFDQWSKITARLDALETATATQVAEIKKQQNEIATPLYKVAAEQGYDCIDVPDDNNCQFHAVASQLNLLKDVLTAEGYAGLAIDDVDLRKRAVGVIMRNKQHFGLYIEDGNIDAYLTRMEKVGEWGDQFTLLALSQALNVNIALLHIDGSTIHFPDPPKSNALVTLHIGCNGYTHYWSLKPKQPAASSLLPLNSPSPSILSAQLEETKQETNTIAIDDNFKDAIGDTLRIGHIFQVEKTANHISIRLCVRGEEDSAGILRRLQRLENYLKTELKRYSITGSKFTRDGDTLNLENLNAQNVEQIVNLLKSAAGKYWGAGVSSNGATFFKTPATSINSLNPTTVFNEKSQHVAQCRFM